MDSIAITAFLRAIVSRGSTWRRAQAPCKAVCSSIERCSGYGDQNLDRPGSSFSSSTPGKASRTSPSKHAMLMSNRPQAQRKVSSQNRKDQTNNACGTCPELLSTTRAGHSISSALRYSVQSPQSNAPIAPCSQKITS